MNSKTLDYIVVFLLAFFFVENEPISFVRIACEYSDGGPYLYGFPIIYQTGVPWVNSFEQHIYIMGFLVNMAFWFTLVLVIYKRLVLLIKSKLVLKLIRFITLAIFGVHFIVLAWYTVEFRYFHWTYNNNFYEDCETKIKFFPKHKNHSY